MTCKVDLINTSFPPIDRLRTLHAFIILMNLSFKLTNAFFFVLLTIVSNPRYFSGLLDILTPNLHIVFLTCIYAKINQGFVKIHHLSRHAFVALNHFFHRKSPFHCCLAKILTKLKWFLCTSVILYIINILIILSSYLIFHSYKSCMLSFK